MWVCRPDGTGICHAQTLRRAHVCVCVCPCARVSSCYLFSQEMANYSAEDVVKVLTTLVPHLSAAAFQPPDTPMQQQSNHEHKMDALPQVTSCSSSSASQSQPQVTSLPQFTSTPCAHAPSTPQPKFMTPLTPQPNRAPAPQPLNTEHPRYMYVPCVFLVCPLCVPMCTSPRTPAAKHGASALLAQVLESPLVTLYSKYDRELTFENLSQEFSIRVRARLY